MTLLDDMSHLMGKKAISGRGARPVLTGSKYNVASHGIGMRIHILGRLFGCGSSMHAHMREILTESRFHECAGLEIEGLALGTQYILYDGWRSGLFFMA
jgi:hypothetical protein